VSAASSGPTRPAPVGRCSGCGSPLDTHLHLLLSRPNLWAVIVNVPSHCSHSSKPSSSSTLAPSPSSPPPAAAAAPSLLAPMWRLLAGVAEATGWGGRHWVGLRRFGGVWYNLDSHLPAPEPLGDVQALCGFLHRAVQQQQATLLLVTEGTAGTQDRRD
ncbi:hypothetical protein Agub_g2829, partial [Astrephomene gubernaculifera]